MKSNSMLTIRAPTDTVCHNIVRTVCFFKLKRLLTREKNNNLKFFYYLHELNPSIYLFLK